MEVFWFFLFSDIADHQGMAREVDRYFICLRIYHIKPQYLGGKDRVVFLFLK